MKHINPNNPDFNQIRGEEMQKMAMDLATTAHSAIQIVFSEPDENGESQSRLRVMIISSAQIGVALGLLQKLTLGFPIEEQEQVFLQMEAVLAGPHQSEYDLAGMKPQGEC